MREMDEVVQKHARKLAEGVASGEPAS
jgi:hypothetical protein